MLISLGNLEQITEILDSPQSRAFQLSFWASMGTFLGGLLVILIIRVYPQKSFSKLMGILQSLSAGVMLFITCFHLVPESVEEIGSRQTMIWFFVGVAAFGVLEYFMHDLDHHDHQEDAVETKQEAPRTPMKQKASKPVKSSEKETKEAKQMAKTLAMTFIALFLHNLPEGLGVYLSSLSNARVVIGNNPGTSACACNNAA